VALPVMPLAATTACRAMVSQVAAMILAVTASPATA
jgi:hypothetical protein